MYKYQFIGNAFESRVYREISHECTHEPLVEYHCIQRKIKSRVECSLYATQRDDVKKENTTSQSS